jgi:cytochrome c5
MSEHHPEEHSSFIKTPKQLIVVIVLAFVVPILLIAMLASLASRAVDPGEGPAMSEEAVAKRLKPVGEVVVVEAPEPPAQVAAAPGAPPVAAAPSAAAAAAGKGGDAAKGKTVFDSSCAACHATGVAGAPKAGDKAAWAARLKQGTDALYQTALKGKGAMPPKGGNMALSDVDVKAAVDYMVSQVK